jgi:hypothetical protein
MKGHMGHKSISGLGFLIEMVGYVCILSTASTKFKCNIGRSLDIASIYIYIRNLIRDSDISHHVNHYVFPHQFFPQFETGLSCRSVIGARRSQ